jgi:hypothetical protein
MSLRKSNILFSTIVLLLIEINAQPKDNLSIFYSLIDSSVNVVKEKLSEGTSYSLSFSSPPNLALLTDRLEYAFSNLDILESNDTKTESIKYNISLAEIEYPSLFRDGFLGNYLIERKFTIQGTYIIKDKSDSNISNVFLISHIDTVDFSTIKSLENNSLPFTTGNIPTEPFFSSLFEPIIAIGTAVLTVILFFTVRSK